MNYLITVRSLTPDNVSKILLAAYPTTAICEMAEMASDNTDAYPNNFSAFNRLQEDLYKWEDSSEREDDSQVHCGSRVTLR